MTAQITVTGTAAGDPSSPAADRVAPKLTRATLTKRRIARGAETAVRFTLSEGPA